MASQRERVGFVGLGRMGLSMAINAVKGGFAVSGYDVDAERTGQLAQHGGAACQSPAEVAQQSTLIVVMVVDDVQAEQVVAGARGVLESARSGTAVIISSSVQPMTCQRLAAQAGPHGVEVMSAPVTRGEGGARDGTLLFLAGGPRALVERCRPLLEAMGKDIFHVGENPGDGQVAKSVNNLMLWAAYVCTYEGFALAQALGLDLRTLQQAMAVSTGTNAAVQRWFADAGAASAPWAEKDMDSVLEMAGRLRLPLPLCGVVREELKLLRGDQVHPAIDTPLGRAPSAHEPN